MHSLSRIQYLPYTLFLIFVLFPLGVLSYTLAAILRTILTNFLAGWKDHGQ